MLAHSPAPLPITICYTEFQIQDYPVLSPEDERNALLAISHRDRVRRIALSLIAVTRFEIFLAAMEGEFPILERLFLAPTTLFSPDEAEIDLTLPRTFQAPNQHHIHLMGVAFPIPFLLLTTSPGGLPVLAGWNPGNCLLPTKLYRYTSSTHAPVRDAWDLFRI
jgi:hypothetical protein